MGFFYLGEKFQDIYFLHVGFLKFIEVYDCAIVIFWNISKIQNFVHFKF